MAFDPSGRFLISGAKDGSVKKWHLGSSGPQVTVRHTNVVTSLAFSDDDEHLWMIGGESKDLKSVDIASLKKMPVNPPMDSPKTVAVSPDGQQLAIAGADQSGCCTLSDKKLNVLHRWNLTSNMWPTPVFSPDGRWLIVAHASGELSLFDTRTGEAVWKGGSSRTDVLKPNPAIFSRDGRYVLNGSLEGTIRVLDVATGELLREFPVRDAAVAALLLDSSGDGLFCGGTDTGKIDVWDWRTGQLLRTMVGHTGWVTALAMLPDGRRLVSVGADATVRLWDVTSGRQVMVIGRHDESVVGVAVSHDGATIATCGLDNALRLWETREPPIDGLDARYERARPTWVGFRSDD
jgi:WD40 repeat protein